MKYLVASILSLSLCHGGFAQQPSTGDTRSNQTTAWHAGGFHVDVAGVIGRSDIVLGQANKDASEALPLGNGRLGAAVWAADGLTAQLNRADTLPDRLSPGQVLVPGLTAMTQAEDFSGRLDLYNGEIKEQGGGLHATVYVQPGTDTLVIDVTGANAEVQQTAKLMLWEPRVPHAIAKKKVGLLREAWIDNQQPESSGRRFGSLSAITAQGRDVSASVVDARTVAVSFKPFADGHYRILVGSPHFNGQQDAYATAVHALTDASPEAHRIWWHDYWHRAAPMKIESADGTGEYMENLRAIYLFAAAAEKGTEYPGSQAGVADMLSSARDAHRWAPSAFWHWNLRMMVAANLGAGVEGLNAPYFNLYRENLPAIESWTRTRMKGSPGICVPETMRFNGRGIEYEGNWKPATIGYNCDAGFKPYYNARTLSTGAEVSLRIWQQYLVTGDLRFLAENYPVMLASTRFLLAYQKVGADGLLHTSPSNAHETQWDVIDPTTDLSAEKALYPVMIQAATLLHRDTDLVRQLESALPKLPPFPRIPEQGARTLLPVSADADGHDVIAESYVPSAAIHNVENIGLEPVWPYDLIGESSPMFELAKRTYAHRPSVATADWSYDPVQAARLDLGSEVRSMLLKITESTQHSINGFANWDKEYGEFYVEQTGVAADALQEALVQDYDGLIRLAPAVPQGWNIDGSVNVRGRTRVDVQVREGSVTTAVIEAGTTGPLRVRNPWPGEAVDVVSGAAMAKVVNGTTDSVIAFHAVAGTSYLLKRQGTSIDDESFGPVTGTPAVTAKRLGRVQIGLFSSNSTSMQEAHGTVVTLGASITAGVKSTPDTSRDWPSVLAARLADEGSHISVLNKGISGNRLLVNGAGPSALSRFDRDVLSQPDVHWVIFSDDPINDLGSTRPAPTGDQLIAGIQQLIARAHQKDIQFFCSTLTPYEGANYWTSSGEVAREQVNAFLHSEKSGCDAVIDQDAATHDPAHPTRYLPAYDSGDHLHPNDAGHRAIANAIDLSLFSDSDEKKK
ncbi:MULTISPECIES: SGNH/GDSL hydrolase family protein [Acidobacteriaceae]|uniref:SGNH/GDSL hydrolase family protein n=1 Tax=Acidobacteriaceae TaxID=204434 RepID=UPI00131AD2EA|nr:MULTISPECIES: SGNH/GDSL hydrolase family protein [Acidobacteriaceae]MDW5265491.1 SGNH/GDSL hydrolase family protein [Edaphobacter sp.]